MNGLDPQQHQEAVDETIAEAQAMLDLHPDGSPYWDSNHGQETLLIARESGLTAANSNAERRAIHNRLMRQALAESQGAA